LAHSNEHGAARHPVPHHLLAPRGSNRTLTSPSSLTYRAYARIGSAHLRLGDYDSAIKSFNKSLTEHRTPDVLAKLKEAEKEKSEKERLAYIDPVKADEAREEGNKLFKVR